jgi:UDP-galactopyranose mutase
MPKDGFTEMVANMLRHPRIKLKLGTEANNILHLENGKIYLDGKEFDGELIYTGCVDELFKYKFGVLPYRSLKFKFQTKNTSSYQPSAVVNYTTSKKFTRISEFSKFACKPAQKTVIVKEYSRPFKKGKNIPYYPIPLDKNYVHYGEYVVEAAKYENLHLLGRLANYKYINMDIAVLQAIKLYNEIKG